MRSRLEHILQVHADFTLPVPNDPDGGAFVVGEEGDHILWVQKPPTVIIPRVEVALPLEAPEAERNRQREEAANDKIETMLWAVLNQRAPAQANGTGSVPCVPERLVLEALQAQINPPGRIVWLLAGSSAALDAAYRIAATFRASKSGPMEVLKLNDATWDVIIGTTNPAGFRLECPPHTVTGPDIGFEVYGQLGWLIYPGKVAAVELVQT